MEERDRGRRYDYDPNGIEFWARLLTGSGGERRSCCGRLSITVVISGRTRPQPQNRTTTVAREDYSSETLCALDFGGSRGSPLAVGTDSVLGALRLSKALLRAGFCVDGCGGAFARRSSSTLLLPDTVREYGMSR
jgi:hypothetical protein